MQSIERDAISEWFLAGIPLVRLWGRDFDMPLHSYRDWLVETARAFNVDVQIKKLTDPPGFIMRAYIGEEPEQLPDPLLAVNKKAFPYLYCPAKGCPVRLPEGVLGATCKKHEKVFDEEA